MNNKLLFASLAVIAMLVSHDAMAGSQTDCTSLHGTMDITGYGKVQIRPDEARITFNVTELKDKAQEARDACEKKALAFQQALDKLKVDKKNVLSASISLQPHYTYDKRQEKQVLEGYEANRTIEVKLSDFALIPQVTDAAMNAGINEIGGIEYRLKDESAVKREADSRAIADARDQAQRLADGFGVKLLKACSLSFQGRSNASIFRNQRMMSARAVMLTAENSDAPEAEYNPDELTVESTVHATYAID